MNIPANPSDCFVRPDDERFDAASDGAGAKSGVYRPICSRRCPRRRRRANRLECENPRRVSHVLAHAGPERRRRAENRPDFAALATEGKPVGGAFKKVPEPTLKVTLEEYSNSATFAVPVTVKPGTKGSQTATLKVQYQICNEKQCLPPATMEVPVTFSVAAGTPRANRKKPVTKLPTRFHSESAPRGQRRCGKVYSGRRAARRAPCPDCKRSNRQPGAPSNTGFAPVFIGGDCRRVYLPADAMRISHDSDYGQFFHQA